MSCHLNETKYIIAGAIHSGSAAVSFFASLSVITVIILFKKLRFFSQRLILYLSLAAMLYSIAAASSKTDYYIVNKATETFCKWIAFATEYTQWCLLLAVCVITGDILGRMVRAEKAEHPNMTSCYLELFYIFLIFIAPATFTWLPLYNKWNMYGISEDWCWIRDKVPTSDGECKIDKRAIAFQFGLWYGPLFVVCCLIIISYIVILLMLRYQRRHMSMFSHEKIQLLREMRQEIYCVIWYPIVFTLINIFPLADRIAMIFVTEPVYELLILHAVISPLQGGFICLVYGAHPHTRNSLRWSKFREAVVSFCSDDEHKVRPYKAEATRERGDMSEKRGLLRDKDNH